MRKIQSNPITADNFKSFGQIVTMPAAEPTSQAEDYKFWSDIAHYFIEGETEIGICTVYQQSDTIISALERHLHTPEILIPIDAPFALPLLKDGEPPDQLKTFRVNVGEAVVVDKEVWHGPCLPVGKKESSYFVIFRRNTPHEDVQKKEIPPLSISL